MKWYKRDPAAALEGMTGLTMEERGAYNFVIDTLYARDGNIPTEDDFFSHALKCRPQTWRRVRDSLVAKGKLHVLPDGKLTANRVANELQTASKLIANLTLLGRVSAQKRNEIKESRSTGRWLKPQPQPHPEKIDTTAATARARDPLPDITRAGQGSLPPDDLPPVADDATEIIYQLGRICGYADASHWPEGWGNHRATTRVRDWLKAYSKETILAAAKDSMRRRGKAPNVVWYFEGAIADAHQRITNPRPLPIVVTSTEPEKINGTYRSNQPGGRGESLAELSLRFAREAAEQDGAPDDRRTG
jgi:uncharacterized protein YdaU (DUF1376 family)